MATRRDMLRLAATAAALPGATEFFSAWLKAADTHHAGQNEATILRDYQPQFLAPADFRALAAFTEILIPTDSTPGAREAYCAHYIDFLLHAADQMPALQKQWRAAMDAVRATGFHEANREKQEALVAAMAAPERDAARSHPAFKAFQLIKTQNAFAFYTSRAGMIETLDYRGNTFNISFPGCTHPEHHQL